MFDVRTVEDDLIAEEAESEDGSVDVEAWIEDGNLNKGFTRRRGKTLGTRVGAERGATAEYSVLN